MRVRTVRLLPVVVGLGTVLLGPHGQAAARPDVVRLDLAGAIQPLSAQYVVDGIARASAEGAQAVLLRIDTPGGLDGSMRRIVGAILDAPIPVVCWVGPQGARAASAGTFVLLACPVATMAAGTSVGAAHPVGLRGEVLSEKATNDAAAFLRGIARERGRDVTWADDAVRRSASLSAREAAAMRVVDGVAGSPQAALRFADDRTVTVAGRQRSLDTWPAAVRAEGMGARGLLGSLVDPNLAYLLFLLGLAGIVVEVLHPGVSVPGVLGLLAVVLALVMFEMLPVNLAGVLLLVAGAGFLLLELAVQGIGLPTAAAVACFVTGGALLFDAGTLVRVGRPVLAGALLGTGVFGLVVVRGAVRARREPSRVGPPLAGAEGVAVSDVGTAGTVRVRGEEWSAEAVSGAIPAGSRIVVLEQEGLRLRVDRF